MSKSLDPNGESRGFTPTPFHSIYHHVQREDWYTHPISSLWKYQRYTEITVERLLLSEANPMSRVFQNIDPPTPLSARRVRNTNAVFRSKVLPAEFQEYIYSISRLCKSAQVCSTCVCPQTAHDSHRAELCSTVWQTSLNCFIVTRAEPVFLNLQGAQESIPIPSAYVAWRVGS